LLAGVPDGCGDRLAPRNAFVYLSIGEPGGRAGLGPYEDTAGLSAVFFRYLVAELSALQLELS
jgi:hypothetical protein